MDEPTAFCFWGVGCTGLIDVLRLEFFIILEYTATLSYKQDLTRVCEILMCIFQIFLVREYEITWPAPQDFRQQRNSGQGLVMQAPRRRLSDETHPHAAPLSPAQNDSEKVITFRSGG